MTRWERSALCFLFSLCIPAVALGEGRDAGSWCGKTVDGTRDAVWTHRARTSGWQTRTHGITAARQDVGDVAIIVDEGDIAVLRNPVDLHGAGLQFSPTAAGYGVVRVDRPVDSAAGQPLQLGDDDSIEVALPFSFRFYGRDHTRVFVNSDGNLTFDEPDNASTARSLGRMVGGPPRIAPLLADFNPTAGGQVVTVSQGDRFSVIWRQVPQWDVQDANTFEVTLRADGTVEFVYATELNAEIEQGVAGVAPGRNEGGVVSTDLSSAAGTQSAGALVENYAIRDEVDTVAIARRFYQTHPDDYVYLVVFTNRPVLGGGTFAFQQTVKATETGTGQRPNDFSGEFGSAGRLESFVMMGHIEKYPDDFADTFLGTDSALSVLAHEVGHRWLSSAVFRDGDANSRELLGRAEVHWSFFMDSDASFLEGNDLEDLGGGQFRTGESSRRYSALDQYLMGLRSPGEVPPLFFARDPSGLRDLDPGRNPRPAITFSGTRVDVTIDDLIAAMGPRMPAVGEAPTHFRQAYIYVVIGDTPNDEHIAKVDRFRQAFEPYFLAGTEGRASVETRLY